MRLRTLTLVLTIALLGVGVAACGDDDSESGGGATEAPATEAQTGTAVGTATGGGGEPVELAADPTGELAYEQQTLSATAGTVTIDFTNDSSVPHDVVIEQDGEELARTDVITQDTAQLTTELEPGSYTFFCSVAGHREAGMEGSLTVE